VGGLGVGGEHFQFIRHSSFKLTPSPSRPPLVHRRSRRDQFLPGDSQFERFVVGLIYFGYELSSSRSRVEGGGGGRGGGLGLGGGGGGGGI